MHMSIVNQTKFKNRIKKLHNVEKDVMPNAFDYFKSITPVDTGHARRNTFLRNFVIHAKYSYAWILDKGRQHTSNGDKGSRKAPDGMSQPTIAKIKQLVATFIRKV